MKPVCEAIRYGLDTLDVSADKLRGYIEESEGYEGDNNDRWVASQIIKVAEKNNVLFTQLLQKWDLYIVEIEEEILSGSGMVMSPEFIERLNTINEDRLTVSFGRFDEYVKGIDGVTTIAEDGTVKYDWRYKLDMYGSPEFSKDLGDEVLDALNTGKPITILASLNGVKPIDRKSDLVADAKTSGTKLVNEGQALLYRLNTMHRSFLNADIRVVLFSTQKFWNASVNKTIIKEFLNKYKLDEEESFYASAKVFDETNHRDGLNVLIVADNDPAKKTVTALDLPDMAGLHPRLFLNDGQGDFNYYYETHNGTTRVPSILNNELNGFKNAGVDGDVLGYYCKNGNITVENFPREGAKSAAIFTDDLPYVIASFGLTKSLNLYGEYTTGIPRVLTGQEGIEKLVADSIPLFLFGPGSNLRDWGQIQVAGGGTERLSNLLAFDAPAMTKVLEQYGPFMDFESRKFLDDMLDIEEVEEMPVHEYRQKCLSGEIEDADFLRDYENSLDKVREHINRSYRHFI